MSLSPPHAASPHAAWSPLADVDARAAYVALLAASAQATPFSGLPFADAACAAFGFTGHLLLAHDAAGEASAGLVVFEKRRGPLRAAALPPYAEFVTPVLRAPLDAAEVHRHASPLDALAAALAARLHQSALRLHPTIRDARPLAWAGWTLTPAYHAVAPLDGDDGLAAWGSAPRRTARRHADAFEILEGRDQIGPAVDLAEGSMAAKGLGHPPRAAVVRLAEALVDAGQARALTARPAGGGPAQAGVVAAVGEGTGHYWIAGSEPGPAMTVLLAHLAGALRAAGCTRLHLSGANVPGVAEFKRRLGAELVPALRARRVGPHWLRALDALRPT